MTRRSAVAFSLSLLLLVTAIAFGAARGQTRVAGQVVLCIGGAAVTIEVDEDGQPVGAVHVCPDCALSSLAAVVPLAVESLAPVSFTSLAPRLGPQDRRGPVWRPRGSARGPPTSFV